MKKAIPSLFLLLLLSIACLSSAQWTGNPYLYSEYSDNENQFIVNNLVEGYAESSNYLILSNNETSYHIQDMWFEFGDLEPIHAILGTDENLSLPTNSELTIDWYTPLDEVIEQTLPSYPGLTRSWAQEYNAYKGWQIEITANSTNNVFDSISTPIHNVSDRYFARLITDTQSYNSEVITIGTLDVPVGTPTKSLESFNFTETIELEIGETATLHFINPDWIPGSLNETFPPVVYNSVSDIFFEDNDNNYTLNYVEFDNNGDVVTVLGDSGGEMYVEFHLFHEETTIPIDSDGIVSLNESADLYPSGNISSGSEIGNVTITVYDTIFPVEVPNLYKYEYKGPYQIHTSNGTESATYSGNITMIKSQFNEFRQTTPTPTEPEIVTTPPVPLPTNPYILITVVGISIGAVLVISYVLIKKP